MRRQQHHRQHHRQQHHHLQNLLKRGAAQRTLLSTGNSRGGGINTNLNRGAMPLRHSLVHGRVGETLSVVALYRWHVGVIVRAHFPIRNERGWTKMSSQIKRTTFCPADHHNVHFNPPVCKKSSAIGDSSRVQSKLSSVKHTNTAHTQCLANSSCIIQKGRGCRRKNQSNRTAVDTFLRHLSL